MAVVRRNDYISPYFNDDDGILYHGKVYSSVMDYILREADYNPDDLAELVLGKFTQHVYYQKRLDTLSEVAFQDIPIHSKEHTNLAHAYQTVATWLRLPDQNELNVMFNAHGLRHIPYGEKREKAIRFFLSALPFKGKNQALFLTLVYANKLVYGCMYDRRVEKMLLSLNCEAV